MASTTTINFESILRAISKINFSERETLEALLDKEFARAILKRGKEINRLRKNNRLLSFAEIQKEFSK